MKKLFLRLTSVALVLLLLFAAGGCKTTYSLKIPSGSSASQTMPKEVLDFDLAIYIDEQGNMVLQRSKDILLQYPIENINMLHTYSESGYSSGGFFYSTQNPSLAMKCFCGIPLIFSKTTLTDTEKNELDELSFSEFSDKKRNDLISLGVLNDGALVFKDDNGEYYRTDKNAVDMDKFMKNYQPFKFEN